MTENINRSQRKYPGFYEKFVPVAIGLLAILIIGMLAFTVAVGTGILHFG
jgi:hypothetical protein